MGRGQSAGKRRIEDQRKQRQLSKAERREERQKPTEPVDQTALMERFRTINEQHADGLLTDSEFTAERDEILIALGIDPPA